MKRLLLICLICCGCAVSRSGPDTCFAAVAGIRYCLLPPESLQVMDGETRLVLISADGENTEMLNQVSFRNGVLTIVASGLLGQPLFTLQHSAGSIELTPATTKLDKLRFVALLQLAYADATQVNRMLDGARVLEDAQGNSILRRIDGGGETIMLLEQTNGGEEIRVPRAGLRIRISRLSQGEQ